MNFGHKAETNDTEFASMRCAGVHHAASGEHRLRHDEKQDGIHRAADGRALIF